MNPRFPIYIVSKGRWESRLTVKALEAIGIPFRCVIEPQEYENYSKVINPSKLLTLPFSNLGQGSIPARNWIWEHAISENFERHWILDDNIRNFRRIINGSRKYLRSPAGFVAIEDFVERYENIALAGMQYTMFAGSNMGSGTLRNYNPQAAPRVPVYFNTRIYSCILIKNSLPYRWRGRYNEDTDLYHYVC